MHKVLYIADHSLISEMMQRDVVQASICFLNLGFSSRIFFASGDLGNSALSYPVSLFLAFLTVLIKKRFK